MKHTLKWSTALLTLSLLAAPVSAETVKLNKDLNSIFNQDKDTKEESKEDKDNKEESTDEDVKETQDESNKNEESSKDDHFSGDLTPEEENRVLAIEDKVKQAIEDEADYTVQDGDTLAILAESINRYYDTFDKEDPHHVDVDRLIEKNDLDFTVEEYTEAKDSENPLDIQKDDTLRLDQAFLFDEGEDEENKDEAEAEAVPTEETIPAVDNPAPQPSQPRQAQPQPRQPRRTQPQPQPRPSQPQPEVVVPSEVVEPEPVLPPLAEGEAE